MQKTFLIGIKDLRLAFRDRAALILMLAAPFVLTLGLGLVTGRFGGNNSSSLSDIPVVIVNLDQQQLGNALEEVFSSEDLADLMEPTTLSNEVEAHQMIDDNQAAAAVIIPQGFTRSVIPQQGDFDDPNLLVDVKKIEIYTNPSRPTGAGVVKAVVDEFLSRVDEGSLSGQISILQLLASGRITSDQAEAAGIAFGEKLQAEPTPNELPIKINTTTADGETAEFDVLAYLAPGMALMFLMYTVTYGGRSILAEKSQGTLPRLLVSPTSAVQILGGKIFGIFLTGTAQLLILIGGTSLFFQVKWGDPLGVLMLVLAAAFGATGWGMLITALAQTPAQVGSIGSATMLIFGIMGGSFISLYQMPQAIQTFSKITPNSWALDGFLTLGLGGSLSDLTTQITALLVMGAVLFAASVFLFSKKNLAQK